MRLPRLTVAVVAALAVSLPPAGAQPSTKAPAQPAKTALLLPHTKLPRAELIPDLCLLRYRVSTDVPECQAFFDQGLGFYYSYTWTEAARSFDTATQLDPSCAMAWLGLSKACAKWGHAPFAPPLKKAQELLPAASHREGLLIRAWLQEKGMIPGITPENRKKEAIKTLDELLTLFDEDEEGWFGRAQLAEGPNAAVPYYKALLRINGAHPGAHHELLHHYENIRRPALGWQHAVGYMQSSPGLPHAFHMQSHLAMRIGKWDKTTDNSVRAVEMEEAYHKRMKINGADGKLDPQFPHHLETLMRSLLHDGRYREAEALKKKCATLKISQKPHSFRLHLAERNWEAALKVANSFTKDKATASYMRAQVYLRSGEPERAAPEVGVLQEAFRAKRADKGLELRLMEVQGLLACARGEAGGLKLLARVVENTKADYGHHSWGQGGYFMEVWGDAALKMHQLDVAEEAFLEALAHDSGSVRGALGMQVVCERLNRVEEAARFAALAQRCWRRADPGLLQAELQSLRGTQANKTTVGTAPGKAPAQ